MLLRLFILFCFVSFRSFIISYFLSFLFRADCAANIAIQIAYFFDMDCNHRANTHTHKRLKFIKICIAKIQINRIQITQKHT